MAPKPPVTGTTTTRKPTDMAAMRREALSHAGKDEAPSKGRAAWNANARSARKAVEVSTFTDSDGFVWEAGVRRLMWDEKLDLSRNGMEDVEPPALSPEEAAEAAAAKAGGYRRLGAGDLSKGKGRGAGSDAATLGEDGGGEEGDTPTEAEVEEAIRYRRPIPGEFYPRLLQPALLDKDTGAQMYEPDERYEVRALPEDVVEHFARVAMRVSKLDAASQKEVEGNSETTRRSA